MPALIHKQIDGTQKQIGFGSKPLIIGRLPESEIQVRDAFISRVQAAISFANGAFILKDLGSTNGTYRNGARVYECNLATGDKIHVGNATLVFEIDADGNGLLQQVPRQTTAPVAASLSAPLLRPGEKQTTIPIKVTPPPPAAPRSA